MVIRRSAAQEVQALLADLQGDDSVRREAAIARLRVIGVRAVEKLVAVASARTQPATVRVAALRALEPIDDRRALDLALATLDDADEGVATAAIGVTRRFLSSEQAPLVLDRLAALALDATRRPPLRLAALDALGEVQSRALEPIWQQLRRDGDPRVRAVAAGPAGEGTIDPLTRLEAIVSGPLPDDPSAVRDLVAAAGADAPLPTLHRLVQALAEQEKREKKDLRQRAEWQVVRGAVHQALAARQSRVALYDLRESVEKAVEPVPVDFVSAISAIGDASCLESLAAAYDHAAGRAVKVQDWWPRALADAFDTIVRREKLSSRHAVIKRIRTRWPHVAARLLPR